MHLLMGYIYLASGFIVSFLLLVGMVIWPFNKNLYRKYAFYLTYAQWSRKYLFQGVQRMMVLVVNFFVFLKIIIFCCVVDTCICDLVHDVEAIFHLNC